MGIENIGGTSLNYTEPLTDVQHAFRIRAIREILQFIRERECCSGVFRDSGLAFHTMTYAKLCEYYVSKLERQVPDDCRR